MKRGQFVYHGTHGTGIRKAMKSGTRKPSVLEGERVQVTYGTGGDCHSVCLLDGNGDTLLNPKPKTLNPKPYYYRVRTTRKSRSSSDKAFQECVARGANVLLGPTLNIHRSAEWGSGFKV